MRPRTQTGNGLDVTIRCIVAEDHVLLRQGLLRLLEDEPDIEVVSEAANEAETLQRTFELRPDVLLVGSNIFGLAATDAERLIRKESPQSIVLFIGNHEKHPAVLDIHADGAKTTVRNTSITELIEMVRSTVQALKMEVHPMPRRGDDEWDASKTFAPRNRNLTTREREVLKLLAEGKTVRSAAEVLGVSVKTVDAHKFNLMRKLGVHNKAELVMSAILQKIIKVPANF